MKQSLCENGLFSPCLFTDGHEAECTIGMGDESFRLIDRVVTKLVARFCTLPREPSPVLGRGGDITCYSWFEYNFG